MPDWLNGQSGNSIVGTNGTCIVLLSQDNAAAIWEIQQISVQVGPASTQANVGIFKNGNPIAPTSALVPTVTVIGSTVLAQTAAGLPYAYLGASDTIQIVVSAATAGDQVNVRAQYREFSASDPNMIGR